MAERLFERPVVVVEVTRGEFDERCVRKFVREGGDRVGGREVVASSRNEERRAGDRVRVGKRSVAK